MHITQITCECGDLKLGWDDVNDPDVRRIIEQKLAEGFHFFRQSARDPEEHIRIRRIADVGNHVIIPDRDFHDLFVLGKIVMVQQADTFDTANDGGTADPLERLNTAAAVMENDSIAHRAHAGG